MKRAILSPVFLLVLGMILVINCKANNILKENYVPQVIIDAPWGEESGQFGLYFPTDPEGSVGVCPFTFAVSPNGEIYILDAANARVQKFDSGGRLLSVIPLSLVDIEMGVDQFGNIYIYDTARVPKRIIQYDSKGNLLKEYPIPWEDGGIRGGDIYFDKSGKIFLTYRSDSLRTQVVFQVGTTEMVFSPEQQRRTLQIGGSWGLNGNLPAWENYLDKIIGKTFSINSKRNDQKSFAKELNIVREGILGIDDEAIYNIAKDEKSSDVSIILKYNYDGDLLATNTLNWKEGECKAFNTEDQGGIWVKEHVVFNKGNIYSSIHCKNGFKIIKWSPVEGKK
jgi:hypothetical protein